jgi:hypothetical protein
MNSIAFTGRFSLLEAYIGRLENRGAALRAEACDSLSLNTVSRCVFSALGMHKARQRNIFSAQTETDGEPKRPAAICGDT